jgi:hypothetical protein
MDYNEYDDYGTGYEEAAEAAYDAATDTAVRLLIEEQGLWGATMADDIAALLTK